MYIQVGDGYSYTFHIAKVYGMVMGDFGDFFDMEALSESTWESLSLLLYFLAFFIMICLSQMILITAMTISDVAVST